MPEPVIVGAVRTAIGRSFKGTLVNTPPETLITAIVPEVIRRAGIDPADIDDMIFAESHYGGGDLAQQAVEMLLGVGEMWQYRRDHHMAVQSGVADCRDQAEPRGR